MKYSDEDEATVLAAHVVRPGENIVTRPLWTRAQQDLLGRFWTAKAKGVTADVIFTQQQYRCGTQHVWVKTLEELEVPDAYVQQLRQSVGHRTAREMLMSIYATFRQHFPEDDAKERFRRWREGAIEAWQGMQ